MRGKSDSRGSRNLAFMACDAVSTVASLLVSLEGVKKKTDSLPRSERLIASKYNAPKELSGEKRRDGNSTVASNKKSPSS